MLLKCCYKPASSTDSLNADISSEPVYRMKNNAQLQEGYTYLITGQIFHGGDRFIVDFGLDNAHKDIALRLAARASTNSLGRSSRIKRTWEPQETSAAAPIYFTRGWNFELQVLFNSDFILIALDGMHIAKYAHRLPLTDIKSIEIRGDMKDIIVEHKFINKYPLRRRKTPHISNLCDRYAETADVGDLLPVPVHYQSNERENQFLPLPYYALFQRGFFKEGYSMFITGHVAPDARKIRISLQFSPDVWPHPTKAMQIEFRFHENHDEGAVESNTSIVFNSFAEDEWTGEIKCMSPIELPPEAEFNLHIMRNRDAFKVHLNNLHIYDYGHILNPDHVNTCTVQGAIKLIDVQIESD